MWAGGHKPQNWLGECGGLSFGTPKSSRANFDSKRSERLRIRHRGAAAVFPKEPSIGLQGCGDIVLTGHLGCKYSDCAVPGTAMYPHAERMLFGKQNLKKKKNRRAENEEIPGDEGAGWGVIVKIHS